MVVRLLIASILAPAVVAVLFVAAARLLPVASLLRRAAALAALAAGYAAGHLAVAGAPSIPPVDTTQGLFWLALAAGLLGLPEALAASAWTRRAARVAAVSAALGLSLHPLVRYQWTAGQTAARTAALALASLALWWGCRALASRLPAGAIEAAWIAVFAGTATLLLLARTALLAQLASIVAVVVAVHALARRSGAGSAAAAAAATLPFLVPMLLAFVLNGLYYAKLGAPAAVALAGSPLAAAVALAVARRRGPSARAAAAVAGVVVLLAPFVAPAAIAYVADDRGYYDYGG